MSSKPQVSPAVGHAFGMFEALSRRAPSSNGATVISCPSVLLVGRSVSWGTSVLKSLAKFGSELTFVAPQAVTSNHIRRGYDLILLDSSVPSEQRRQLAFELACSEASMFYMLPAENDCWWLPTLRRGQDCYGAPAFRRNEFPDELERTLRAPADA
jgi:hypothetical protein